MRDPAEIYTKHGTPIIVIVSRLAFAAYFIFAWWTIQASNFPHSQIGITWLLYLLAIYLATEKLYSIFLQRGIDLTFAWPLVFSVYSLNLVSMLFDGQERLPLLNRAEHFASFVLIAYIVWIFFTKYLPQDVWREHPYYSALLTLSITSTLGVANELIELVLDVLFGTQLIGNELDTPLDLLMNTLGAGSALAVRLILGTTTQSKSLSDN